jgi:glutathione peroxidase
MAFYDVTDKLIDGTEVSMSKFKGDVVLVTNVASKCGLTKINYEQLPALADEYGSKGFKVLAFPCNQFGSQEPGSPQDILDFVKKFDKDMDSKVTFFEKGDVNGGSAREAFAVLKKEVGGSDVDWNFGKFLVDHEGNVVKQYSAKTSPVDIKKDIEDLLAKKGA